MHVKGEKLWRVNLRKGKEDFSDNATNPPLSEVLAGTFSAAADSNKINSNEISNSCSNGTKPVNENFPVENLGNKW